MNRKVTVRFTAGHALYGGYTNPELYSDKFNPEPGQEYLVTLDEIDNDTICLTLADGFQMRFLPPEKSDCYKIIREGWDEPLSAPAVVPRPAILESTLIMTIEPSQHNSLATNTEYLIYKLPRVLNGLLVDRGRCDQETVADRANTEAVGELRGVASFMLTSRNNNLRYRCISFRIDNKTTKKNLTLQYGSGSVCTS